MSTYFLKESARFSWDVAINSSFRGKKILNSVHFLACYSKTKKEECDQSNLSFCSDFGRFILFINTYFLMMKVHVSLKIVPIIVPLDTRTPQKLTFLTFWVLYKNGEVWPNQLTFLWWFCKAHTFYKYMFSGSECSAFNEHSHQWLFWR